MGVIAANRFLAGGRSVISLLAGASRLPFVRTTVWAMLSALLWCVILVAAGAWVGTQWEIVLGVLGTYGRVITALVAAAALVAAIRWYRRRRPGGAAPQETAKTPPEASEGLS